MAVFIVTASTQTGSGSIGAAITSAVSGDVIRIQVSTVNITSVMTVTQQSLTIEADLGGGKATLDAGNVTRIFLIDRDASLSLADLILINASSSDDGGAIRGLPRSTLTIDRCEFVNNTAQTVDGAIFMANRCSLTVRESVFTGNNCITGTSEYMIAAEEAGTGRGGGACGLLTGSQSYWYDSTFTNNSGVAGGAINSLLSVLEMQDCIFASNDSLAAGLNQPAGDANAAGGAVYTDGASDKNEDDYGVIVIRRCRFEGNQSGANGAGVSAYGYRPITTSDPNKGDLIVIEDCLFLDNDCFALTDGSNISLGGGVRIGGHVPSAIVRRCSFVGNSSENQGGGLAVSNQPDIVYIEDCTFSGNSTTGNLHLGGGLITECPTEIRHCTFANNQANQGSAIYMANTGSCDIQNSILYNNSRVADGSYIREVRPDSGFVGSHNIQHPGDGWLLYSGVDRQDPQVGTLTNEGDAYYLPLNIGSPAINTGDPQFSNPLDIRQQQRGSTVDIGSAETFPVVVNVSKQAFIMQSDFTYSGLYFF